MGLTDSALKIALSADRRADSFDMVWGGGVRGGNDVKSNGSLSLMHREWTVVRVRWLSAEVGRGARVPAPPLHMLTSQLTQQKFHLHSSYYTQT